VTLLDAQRLSVTFVVFGVAQPKGSKTGFVPPHPFMPAKNGKCRGGRAAMVDGRRAESREAFALWEERIEHAAFGARMQSNNIRFAGAVNVGARFFFARPLHETIAQRQRIYKTTVPDYDKLVRAVLDPITKVGMLADDSIVVSTDRGGKFYVPYTDGSTAVNVSYAPRVEITVTALENR
jgi:Holliday junction resolvase RusA-like endonuclease